MSFRTMNKPLSLLTKAIIKALGDNVQSILFYGSSTLGLGHDIDLIVVLRKKVSPLENTQKLASVKLMFQDIHLDLQLIYAEELIDANLFSLDAHGSFIIPVLHHAQTLYGDNPFLQLFPKRTQIAIDSLKKIQYYLFKARRAAIGYIHPYIDSNPDIHRKKILKIIFDIQLAKSGSTDSKNIVASFKQSFPHLLTSAEVRMLRGTSTLSIQHALPVYEKLYSFALSYIPLETIIRKPEKFHIGNSIGDYLLTDSKPKGIIILCEGMPALPDRSDLMNRFCRNGYHVFLPRYQGTWENCGTFLKHSPAKEILELCEAINNGIQLPSKQIRSTHVILIGTSFGGSVAIDAADHPSVRRVIALSPVIDFAQMPELKTLGPYLKEFYPGAYRFEQKDWNKLLNGKLIQPLLKLSSPTRKKIKIILGEKDTTIPPEQIKLLPTTIQKQILTYHAVGHISFSKITEPILDDILNLI